MQSLIGRRFVLIALAVACAVAQPAASRAFSTGIPSTVFGPSGCPLCHSGGVAPSVLLSGPTTVAPGSTADYTLTIFGTPPQTHGGFNVSANGGTLSTGGPFAAGTQTISGLAGLGEITHTTPKQGDVMDIIEFSFKWTAPPTFLGTVTLRGWGNNVNADHTQFGDAAALSTLDIGSTAPSPTPTATPTPGPDPCVDIAPLDPPLVTGADAQACQKSIAKAASLYTKKSLKAAQVCLKRLQAGTIAGEPIGLCAGSAAGSVPGEAKAAAAFAKSAAKLRALIAAKCDDTTVAGLGLCAATEAGLEDCVLAAHHQGIVDAITGEYGALQPTADPDARRCQGAIGKSGAGLLNAYLKASDKCLNVRNANGTAGSGADLCIGSMSGGFVPPTDPKVAAAVVKATGKLSSKISSACSETDATNLAACANNKGDLIDCLVCLQRDIAFALLGAQYGGM